MRSDSRYDDTAETLPHSEFFDKSKSGELLARASARVAVVKVLASGHALLWQT